MICIGYAKSIERFVAVPDVGVVWKSMNASTQGGLVMDGRPRDDVLRAGGERGPDAECETMRPRILEALEEVLAFIVVREVGRAGCSGVSRSWIVVELPLRAAWHAVVDLDGLVGVAEAWACCLDDVDGHGAGRTAALRFPNGHATDGAARFLVEALLDAFVVEDVAAFGDGDLRAIRKGAETDDAVLLLVFVVLLLLLVASCGCLMTWRFAAAAAVIWG
eukprot:CAMPEP_0198121954 /NCGR_PEP_ID=MMETSP1442-20131203/33544_1 /TAXON_ID= /ORGANISM="Craspedostauros australis, Strain CCMP3328" /LENGTH=219 /DNA_ID=CAMNT_0043780867 /DNA_START=367 /DNA_END=1022 /DNA_ORIENTATION=-